MADCPDRDCHEKVSMVYKFIWGEKQQPGAASRLDMLQTEVEHRMKKPSPLVFSLLLCVLLPVFGWAWNITVALENRITKLESQYEILQQIDNKVQQLLDQHTGLESIDG
jgi:hypothetical protein